MARDDAGFAEIEEYTKKLSQNPESLVFVPLAESYRKSGMLDEAIETCLKGLQVHPTYMSARMVLGRTYMEKEMHEEAATEFQKVSAADVNNIMAHSLLGQLNIKQGKFTQAIEEFQKVLTLSPDDANAQQLLKQALEQAKHRGPVRAESAPEAPSGSANVPDAKNDMSRAEALTKQGDIENAIKIYHLILEADPENLVVRQKLKDLELRKAQTGTSPERKVAERVKLEPLGIHRDNDKITSDDILSVMKDTMPKAPEKTKSAPRAEAKPASGNEPSAAPVAEPKPSKPESKPEPKAALQAEPKLAEPKPAPVAAAPAESKSQGHAAVSAEIAAALAKLVQIPGIVGTLLVDERGEILNTSFTDQGSLKELSQTAALIFDKTGRAVHAMGYGEQVKQILITGEKGQIFFNKFGARILLVQTDENINIGKMRLALNDVNKVLH